MCIVGKRSLFSCRQALRKISGGQHSRQKTTPFSLLAVAPDPTHLRKRFSPRYKTAWSRRTPALVVELCCPLLVAVNFILRLRPCFHCAAESVYHWTRVIEFSLIFFVGHASGPYAAVDPFGLAASVLLVRTSYCVYLPSSSLRILFLGSRIPTALRLFAVAVLYFVPRSFCSEVSVVRSR